jgi:hypothetical protein
MSGPWKIISNIAAAILLFFGVLFVLSAFGANGQPGNIITGVVLAGIGFVLIYLATRKPKVIPPTQVNVSVDLPGGVQMQEIKCKSCGAVLPADAIKIVAGAPMVSCPYCNTAYQMTEEPKW